MIARVARTGHNILLFGFAFVTIALFLQVI
jgi:hypothetical protein